MSEPARPLPAQSAIDLERDPLWQAACKAPVVPETEEERAALDDAKRLHTHWVPHDEFAAFVASLKPTP